MVDGHVFYKCQRILLEGISGKPHPPTCMQSSSFSEIRSHFFCVQLPKVWGFPGPVKLERWNSNVWIRLALYYSRQEVGSASSTSKDTSPFHFLLSCVDSSVCFSYCHSWSHHLSRNWRSFVQWESSFCLPYSLRSAFPQNIAGKSILKCCFILVACGSFLSPDVVWFACLKLLYLILVINCHYLVRIV